MWGMNTSRPAPATVTLTAGVLVVEVPVAVVPGAVAVVPGAVAVVPAVVVVAEVEVDAVAAAAAARLELALPRGVVTTMVDCGGAEVDRLGDDVVICFCGVTENWGD